MYCITFVVLPVFNCYCGLQFSVQNLDDWIYLQWDNTYVLLLLICFSLQNYVVFETKKFPVHRFTVSAGYNCMRMFSFIVIILKMEESLYCLPSIIRERRLFRWKRSKNDSRDSTRAKVSFRNVSTACSVINDDSGRVKI